MLYDTVSSLDPFKRELLLNNLSFSERKSIVKIFKNRSENSIPKTTINSIISKIDKLQIKITRYSDTRSFLSTIKRTIIKILDSVGYFFNILTAKKTEYLINKILLNNNKSDNLFDLTSQPANQPNKRK